MGSTRGRPLERERLNLLKRLERWLEKPMVALGLAWLVLLVVELTRGLSPFLAGTATAIWILFVLDFTVKFSLAPRKIPFLTSNWLTLMSLAVPALRILRAARAFGVLRAVRGVRLLRVIGSINRGMRALGDSLERRGFGYVIGLTVLVTVAGAAGMYAFERERPNGFKDFSSALWWAAMIMTTMGTENWPVTPEGRILCLFLAVYAFAVFGYVTATVASFFIGRDAESADGETVGRKDIRALTEKIQALEREIAQLAKKGRNEN
jgi:voltage-gated potassium channel